MIAKLQQAVVEFMEKAQQKPEFKPTIPTKLLHHSLLHIFEEAFEILNAVVLVSRNSHAHTDRLDSLSSEIKSIILGIKLEDPLLQYKHRLLLDVLDGLADLAYVTAGAANMWGFNLSKALELVHEANMGKFGPGGHRDTNGKWIKPPDWTPPNLNDILTMPSGCHRTVHPVSEEVFFEFYLETPEVNKTLKTLIEGLDKCLPLSIKGHIIVRPDCEVDGKWTVSLPADTPYLTEVRSRVALFAQGQPNWDSLHPHGKWGSTVK